MFLLPSVLAVVSSRRTRLPKTIAIIRSRHAAGCHRGKIRPCLMVDLALMTLSVSLWSAAFMYTADFILDALLKKECSAISTELNISKEDSTLY